MTGLGVEAPAREDLFFRDNDDKLVGARWYKSDGVTPVVITAAELALELEEPQPPDVLRPAHPIALEPTVHVINGTTPGDADGWLDANGFAQGVVLATVPHAIWAQYSPRRNGRWDIAAVADDGTQRCLVRGCFVVESGVASP